MSTIDPSALAVALLTVDLAATGAQVANGRIREQRFTQFTEAQRNEVAEHLKSFAQRLTDRGVDPDAALERMQRHAVTVVDVVMDGTPRSAPGHTGGLVN